MRISDIKEIIQGSNFHFETWKDFSGKNDRIKENHNVITDGRFRIIARNKTRTKWQVTIFNTDGKLVNLTDEMSLLNCLMFCVEDCM